MSKPALVIGLASISGLLIGGALPAAEQFAQLALLGLFVQTLIAVGGLAERGSSSPRWWATRMLVTHHVCLSLPLLVLGLVWGLDTRLGVGVFVLGAVPPAAGLPGFVAACRGLVRPIVRFCLLAYVVGVVLTPALVLLALGTDGQAGSIVATVVFGLVLPAILGMAGRRRLVRLPRGLMFGIVATCVLLVAVSLGPSLYSAVGMGLNDPAYLTVTVAVGFGRCVWGATWGALLAKRRMRLESALAGGYKNSALAAVIAQAAGGPLAALPCLLGVIAEAAMPAVASVWATRRQEREPTPQTGNPEVRRRWNRG